MKRSRHILISSLVQLGLIVVLHTVLIRIMAHNDVVSRFFALGPHVSWTTMLLMLTFIVVRLVYALCLPGLLVYFLCRYAFARQAEHRCSGEQP